MCQTRVCHVPTVIVPILQMQKLTVKDVEYINQGQDLNLRSLTSEMSS